VRLASPASDVKALALEIDSVPWKSLPRKEDLSQSEVRASSTPNPSLVLSSRSRDRSFGTRGGVYAAETPRAPRRRVVESRCRRRCFVMSRTHARVLRLRSRARAWSDPCSTRAARSDGGHDSGGEGGLIHAPPFRARARDDADDRRRR
jgi:hypothetical protein